jgi:hypothetical protein
MEENRTMRTILGTGLLVVLAMVVAGCHGKGIDTPAGCDEHLSVAHKKQECHACVAKKDVYMPDKPDGSRCVSR